MFSRQLSPNFEVREDVFVHVKSMSNFPPLDYLQQWIPIPCAKRRFPHIREKIIYRNIEPLPAVGAHPPRPLSPASLWMADGMKSGERCGEEWRRRRSHHRRSRWAEWSSHAVTGLREDGAASHRNPWGAGSEWRRGLDYSALELVAGSGAGEGRGRLRRLDPGHRNPGSPPWPWSAVADPCRARRAAPGGPRVRRRLLLLHLRRLAPDRGSAAAVGSRKRRRRQGWGGAVGIQEQAEGPRRAKQEAGPAGGCRRERREKPRNEVGRGGTFILREGMGYCWRS
jgi:hypothetical protein